MAAQGPHKYYKGVNNNIFRNAFCICSKPKGDTIYVVGLRNAKLDVGHANSLTYPWGPHRSYKINERNNTNEYYLINTKADIQKALLYHQTIPSATEPFGYQRKEGAGPGVMSCR